MALGARLWAVRVLDSNGDGTTSTVVAGINWVKANAAVIDVANTSLGGGGSDDNNCGNTNGDSEHKAIYSTVAAGTPFIVAAGNEAVDAKNSIPACYDEVITVSARRLRWQGRTSGSRNLGTVKEQLDHFSAARSGESAVKPRTCDPPSK